MPVTSPPPVERRFVPSRHGQLHVATCGPVDAPAVLLLHQTPRSWKEYRAVLPLLGDRYRTIAMDTVGFGDSGRASDTASIEVWAAAAVEVLDGLAVERAHVVGHHTGGVIAVELAANHPGRVAGLVLSSTPYTEAAFRIARAERPPIDAVEPRPDGSHLAELWQRRQGFYPPDRPDLLVAFVADALNVLDDLEAGHAAVASYRMEDVIELVTSPTLVIRATDDPFAYPHGEELRHLLVNAALVEMVDIEGGMVPLPDQLPDAFAAAVTSFLDRLEG